MHIIIVENL